MYKRLRNLFYLGAIAILVAGFVRFNFIRDANSNTVEPVEISTVDRGDIVLTVNATGAIHAAQEVPLAFASIGKVASVDVKVGDRVRKGQTLATLDTKAQQVLLQNAQVALNLQRVAYNAISAAPRSADVNAAQAAVNAAKAQLSAAGIGYDPTQVKIAQLQVELAKNLAWQSQLSRDQAVSAANAPPPAIISQLTNLAYQLPPQARGQALQLIGELAAPLSIQKSLAPSPQDAEAGVHKTDFDIKVAQAQLDQAKTTGGSAAGIASAQAAIITAQAGLDRLLEGAKPEQLDVAKAQIEAAQAALDLANYNLSRGTLTVPFDGVVAQLNLTAGEPTPTDQPAALLVDDSQYYLDMPVDEADISKVKVGQSVSLTMDALPGEQIPGAVQRIADTSINISGVVTYLVRVTITADGHAIRSGLSSTAVVTVDQISDVLRIRNRFVRLDRKNNKATVIVQLPNGKTKEVEVKLGLRNDTYSEVQSGLAVGDTVVVLPRSLNLF